MSERTDSYLFYVLLSVRENETGVQETEGVRGCKVGGSEDTVLKGTHGMRKMKRK